MQRRLETGDDSIEDGSGELSYRGVVRITRVGTEVEQDRGPTGRCGDLVACRFERREWLDEEMPEFGGAATRRCVHPSLCSIGCDVCDEPMTMRNSENLMERSCVDVLGVSVEFEGEPSPTHIIAGVVEDANRFGRGRTGRHVEVVQPGLERASATLHGLEQSGCHLDDG
jgi:hypothetical protein